MKSLEEGDIVRWLNGETFYHRWGDSLMYDLGQVIKDDGRLLIAVAKGGWLGKEHREIGPDVEFVADGKTHMIG